MEFTARCGCNANSFPISLPSSPLKAHGCTCTSCRTGSGLLMTTHAIIPTAPFDPDSPPDTLSVYDHKPRSRGYFCKTCASPLFGTFGYEKDGEEKLGWCASTGCLVKKDEGGKRFDEDVVLSGLFHVGDTLDGGCASWMKDVEHVYSRGSDSEELSRDDVASMEKEYTASEGYKAAGGESTLEGKCLCGGVRVRIKRKTGWSMNDEDKSRYQTIHCACGDCRHLSGGEVMSYVRVPLINTVMLAADEDGEESEIPWPQHLTDAQRSGGFGNMIAYKRVEDVTRGACKGCGAKVSYQKVGLSGVVLTAGLFGADVGMGSRRDDWFDWDLKGNSSFAMAKSSEEAGRDGFVVKKFKGGLESWK